MKKLTAILIGTLIASSAVLAQTNQVLSRNAVGYVKVGLESNKLYMLRYDFVPLTGGNAITNVIGSSVPNGTKVILWNPGAQQYLPSFTFNSVFGWGAAGTTEIQRGVGFFLQTPAAVAPGANLFLMGEVPDRFTSPSNNSYAVNALNMKGYPYPVATKWTNTTLSASLPNGSKIVTWDTATQQYNASITYSTIFGWGAAGNALVLQPGQGFFINSAGSVPNYTETKPYTWP